MDLTTEDLWWTDPSSHRPFPDLTIDEDNPVIHRLYGPHGETLLVIRERSTVLFGFRGSR